MPKALTCSIGEVCLSARSISAYKSIRSRVALLILFSALTPLDREGARVRVLVSSMDLTTLASIDDELGSSEVAALCFLCRDVLQKKALKNASISFFPLFSELNAQARVYLNVNGSLQL